MAQRKSKSLNDEVSFKKEKEEKQMKADTTTTKNALSAIDSETEILDAVMSNAPINH